MRDMKLWGSFLLKTLIWAEIIAQQTRDVDQLGVFGSVIRSKE